MEAFQKVCVLGLGYIGLPTASLLATKGFDVLGVDIRQDVVNKINSGEIHIVEPGLDVLVRSAVNSGNLKAALKPEEANVFILAVPTPFDIDKKPDLSYIRSATEAVAKVVKNNDLVILESTSPVRTTEFVNDHLRSCRPDLERIHVAHCPERVIPGRVLQELVENDRVIGGIDDAATKKAAEFYSHFVAGKILTTNAKTAEMCKLTENSFRDVNIAFANELSLICDKLDINVWKLIELANHHPRVNILQPGPGVGGHCIAVDPWFIVASCPEHSKLIHTARCVNDGKPNWIIEKVKEKSKSFTKPTIACFGAAFKPDIDDLRESPALIIAYAIAGEELGEVIVCEPHVESIEGLENTNIDDALERADIVLLLVAHKEFKEIPKNKFIDKYTIDATGILSGNNKL